MALLVYETLRKIAQLLLLLQVALMDSLALRAVLHTRVAALVVHRLLLIVPPQAHVTPSANDGRVELEGEDLRALLADLAVEALGLAQLHVTAHARAHNTVLRDVLVDHGDHALQPRQQHAVLHIHEVLQRQHLRARHEVQARLQHAHQLISLLARVHVVVHEI